MANVLDLADCADGSAAEIGGKALGLGRLFEQAVQVPPGFVVTTGMYRAWMREHGFDTEIERLLAVAGDDVTALQGLADSISRMLGAAELSSREVDDAYARLHGDSDAPVAVRSSATGEDGAEASFAGAQDTHLWVRGPAEVRRHIVRCWSSLFTAAAISYRRRLPAGEAGSEMAVVVQEMVEAEVAGVMFTLDPLTGDPSQITIESTYGLGVSLVGGEVTPDRYSFDKVTFELRSRAIAVKPFADRRLGDEVRRVEVDPERAGAASLTDEEALALARLARRVEAGMGAAVDLEWALGPGPTGPRHLYLLQARPETVWSAARRRRSIEGSTSPPTAGGALSRIALGMRKNSH